MVKRGKRIFALFLTMITLFTLGSTLHAISAPGENLALNKTVAISNPDSFWGTISRGAEKIVDGDGDTFAMFNLVDRYGWYEVDLGDFTDLNKIELNFNSDAAWHRVQDFAIDVFTVDGWVRVVRKHLSQHDSNEYTYKFATLSGKKVRLTANNLNTAAVRDNPSDTAEFRLAELSVYYDSEITDDEFTPLDDIVAERAIPETVEKNIALNKAVTVNTNDEWLAENCPISRLTDGLKGDKPAIIAYDPEGIGWYEIDLSRSHEINQVVITNFNSELEKLPRSFAIDVLTDSGWVRVAEKHLSDNPGLVNTFNFEPVTGSKIRYTGNKANNSSADNFAALELEVLFDADILPADYTAKDTAPDNTSKVPVPYNAVNLALYKTVTANTNEEWLAENCPISRVTDGLKGDKPGIIAYNPEGFGWYEIDLNGKHAFNQIIITNFNSELEKLPRSFAIDVLTDGGWVRVAEKHLSDNPGLVNTFNFESMTGSKIRYIGNKASNPSSDNFAVLELEVLSNPNVNESSYTSKDTAPDAKSRITMTYDAVNLALGRPATSSNTDPFFEQFDTNNLTDGEKGDNPAKIDMLTGTGWYEIDLGSATFNEVLITYHGSDVNKRPRDFAIDVYNGEKWVRVIEKHLDKTAEVAGSLLYRFADIKGENLRITAVNANTPDSDCFAILELEVFLNPTLTADDYSQNDKAENEKSYIPYPLILVNSASNNKVASSNTDAELDKKYPAALINDGKKSADDPGAAISWDKNGLAWYQIDYKSPTEINQALLVFSSYFRDARPLDFAVDIYNGKSWVRVAEKHLSEFTTDEFLFNFAPISATSIRVTANNKNAKNKSDFRLLELGTYSNANVNSANYTALDKAPNKESAIPMPGAAPQSGTGEQFPVSVVVIALISFGIIAFTFKKTRKGRYSI